ncbi:MAG: citramalate synthase [Actinobacteria bacterium HGW-Actinobacteria-7]|jgi:2-isopropylmalate synthase|nr:MAG: citramalate synthase [Actinobacteria bacterium HGW-Actinobacteria-7]
MPERPPITIYDTTLRDGTQREGLSLSVEDKLRIAAKLDLLGVHYIEGGFPGSNPKDIEFFERARDLKLETAVISAFGATRRKDTAPEDDPGLAALLETGCSALCIFGKTWGIHVTETLQTTLAENVAMVRDSVAHLKAAGRTVFFDAEHFFDGYKADAAYALEVCRAAADAGADAIVLCDTNGGTLPHEVLRIVGEMALVLDVPLGIHTHNDTGCAVANSLIAVEAGCTQVQGTANGYGERAGNADLITIIPSLKVKMGRDCVSDEQLRLLTEVSHFVSDIANLAPNPHQPFVGTSAFAHKGGVHASAAARLPEAYEHIDPTRVGNLARVVVSELAGRASLTLKAQEMGIELASETAGEVLDSIKELEYGGYSFEAADASLEIMLKKRIGSYEPLFRLESFRVIAEKREDGRVMTEATIKVHVGGHRYIATAEGNGPVNALDKALRIAIGRYYPALDQIWLSDFKVRVLDENKGTGAVTRVLIESSDHETSWGTVGVSENIIEASWEALVDAVEYGLAHRARPEE